MLDPTGVGFVGMDVLFRASTADGANLATTEKTFGNLYIARNDP